MVGNQPIIGKTNRGIANSSYWQLDCRCSDHSHLWNCMAQISRSQHCNQRRFCMRSHTLNSMFVVTNIRTHTHIIITVVLHVSLIFPWPGRCVHTSVKIKWLLCHSCQSCWPMFSFCVCVQRFCTPKMRSFSADMAQRNWS